MANLDLTNDEIHHLLNIIQVYKQDIGIKNESPVFDKVFKKLDEALDKNDLPSWVGLKGWYFALSGDWQNNLVWCDGKLVEDIISVSFVIDAQSENIKVKLKCLVLNDEGNYVYEGKRKFETYEKIVEAKEIRGSIPYMSRTLKLNQRVPQW